MKPHPSLPPLAELAADPRRWALFLDFDGTLVELASTPDAIRVPASLPRLLRALADLFQGALAVMTGRKLADLDARLGGLRLAAAGQHGGERRFDPREQPISTASKNLDRVRSRLSKAASSLHGIQVEDKGASIALHYRTAPAMAESLRALAEDIVAESGGALQLMPGKFVFEIRPAGADKGRALEAFLGVPPFQGRLPLVIGDDVTDEEAFAAALRARGSAIKVGEGSTLAPWRIDKPSAVRAWLASRVPAEQTA